MIQFLWDELNEFQFRFSLPGLYEENHGIVNNKMYDPKLNANFTQPNLEEIWWNDMNVQPIWVFIFSNFSSLLNFICFP